MLKVSILLAVVGLWSIFFYNPPLFSKGSKTCDFFANVGANEVFRCPDPDYPTQEMYCLRE